MQNAILQGKTIIFEMEIKITFKELYHGVVFEKKNEKIDKTLWRKKRMPKICPLW